MSSEPGSAIAPIGRAVPAWLRQALPRGGLLPEEEWIRRHRAMLTILWLNVVAIPLYAAAVEGYGLLHTLEHAVALVALAILAGIERFSRTVRAAFASVGLLTAAALLVHVTGGLIEAHFYFFVLIVALTLYEDWVPFLLAVAYVLVHHGLIGTLDPEAVYNHSGATDDPWAWATVHASFVALAGLAGIVAWRLNENVREKMRRAQRDLAVLAETDSLTELANRRKAMVELEKACADAAPGAVLVLFDLDGFKSYNDTFGHPAGDALLARLGQRLRSMTEGVGSVYRLGGDEFCVLAPSAGGERAALEATGAAALSERGKAFSVTASYGSVTIPEEARSPSEAMRLADQRMYARKQSSRPSAMSQSKDVLLKALVERHPELGGHVDEVRELVQPVAESVGMPTLDVEATCHAAELHDVGKVAIPDAILQKPGPLDEAEWRFIRRHTLIGQRIVAEAPALGRVGELIRSSHERWDGEGYPDRLAGAEIPLGSRIIAVCDAYDAMTSDRPYRLRMSDEDAVVELRRCAGTQFDPRVVEAFVETIEEKPPARPIASALAS